MISIANIEVKVGLVLALSAFVISPLVGIVSGISVLVVLIRTVVVTLIFFGLGFGALILIKKFVPEVYEILSSTPAAAQNPEEIETGVDQPEEEFSSDSPEEFDDSGGPNESSYDPGIEPMAETGAAGVGKMGRHILEEKNLKYEPKIMAEAIRTMMSRDDE